MFKVQRSLLVMAALAPLLLLGMIGTTASGANVSFPVTVHGANGAVRIAGQPHAIVSLSPTATEMLYAIGAGHQVKAVDKYSDYPAGTPMTTMDGNSPNVEAIA